MSFQVLLASATSINNALHVVCLDEIGIPTAREFFVVYLVIFNQTCPTQAFVGKPNLLLMVILPHISRADQPLTKFDQIEADCPLLVVHFNDGNFSVLVTGSPRIHQPPHPILKHQFECSILCTDEHTSQRAGFDSKDDYQWMTALLNGRC